MRRIVNNDESIGKNVAGNCQQPNSERNTFLHKNQSDTAAAMLFRKRTAKDSPTIVATIFDAGRVDMSPALVPCRDRWRGRFAGGNLTRPSHRDQQPTCHTLLASPTLAPVSLGASRCGCCRCCRAPLSQYLRQISSRRQYCCPHPVDNSV